MNAVITLLTAFHTLYQLFSCPPHPLKFMIPYALIILYVCARVCVQI